MQRHLKNSNDHCCNRRCQTYKPRRIHSIHRLHKCFQIHILHQAINHCGRLRLPKRHNIVSRKHTHVPHHLLLKKSLWNDLTHTIARGIIQGDTLSPYLLNNFPRITPKMGEKIQPQIPLQHIICHIHINVYIWLLHPTSYSQCSSHQNLT